jgi:hypothetical protein
MSSGKPISQNADGNADVALSRFKSAESRERSLSNLRPWTKQTGERPAPKSAGRPKRHPLEVELEKALRGRLEIDPQRRTFHQLIAEAFVKQCAKGNVDAIKVLFERQLGRVRYSDEEPPPTAIVINILRNQIRDFSDRDTEAG